MFSYLVSQERPNEPQIALAITVKNNVITVYRHHIPVHTGILGFLQKVPVIRQAINAFSQSQIKKSYDKITLNYEANAKITFGHRHDKDHPTMHSSDADENNVNHMHLRHHKKVTIKTLKSWLDDYSGLPHRIRQDILHRFREYMTNHTKQQSTFSNNVVYQALANNQSAGIPTIAEHAECISEPQYTGCGTDNPLNPSRMQPNSMTTFSSVTNIKSDTVDLLLATGIGVGTALYWMFKPKAKAQTKPSNIVLQHIREQKQKAFG